MSEETAVPADPRVSMARQRRDWASARTKLALDRTTLAWVRTSLALASFGFGMVTFFRSRQIQAPSAETMRLHQGAIRMGTAFLVLGIVATILAAAAHWLALRALRRGASPSVTQWSLSITVALLLAVIGLAGLWHLFVL